MKKVILALALTLNIGCGTVLLPKAPPNLPPEVTAQFYATSVMQDLDKVRDFAASLARVNVVSKATALAVVDWHEELVGLIHAAPGGWRAVTLKGLDDLPKRLPPADSPKFKAYIDSIRLFIQEVQ